VLDTTTVTAVLPVRGGVFDMLLDPQLVEKMAAATTINAKGKL
jgi:hypothetical protein